MQPNRVEDVLEEEIIQKINNIGHRENSRWLQLVLVFGLFVTCVSCRDATDVTVPEKRIATTDAKEAISTPSEPSPADTESNTKAGKETQESPEFVPQELDQLSSPFTKETVLALNAIVARSLAAIESFDERRKDLNEDDPASVAATLKHFSELSVKAKQARTDMEAAEKRLLESGEKYNDAIFAAMVRFVEGVDDEIKEEIGIFSKLQKSPQD